MSAVANNATLDKTAPLMERKAVEIEAIMKKYPDRRSGAMAVLWLVQDDAGWISAEAMEEVAEICEMQPSEVLELVTFYTMYHRQPVGKYVFGVCGTLPCALCGSDGLIEYLKEKLGVDPGEISEDGLFTIKRMECLGACDEAPLMLVNKRLASKLTRRSVDEIILRCRQGEKLD